MTWPSSCSEWGVRETDMTFTQMILLAMVAFMIYFAIRVFSSGMTRR